MLNNVSLCSQAEEQSGEARYATAELHIIVEQTNRFPPTITVSIEEKTGYIYENSPQGSIVVDAFLTKNMQIFASDPDEVRIKDSLIKYVHTLLVVVSKLRNTNCI